MEDPARRRVTFRVILVVIRAKVALVGGFGQEILALGGALDGGDVWYDVDGGEAGELTREGRIIVGERLELRVEGEAAKEGKGGEQVEVFVTTGVEVVALADDEGVKQRRRSRPEELFEKCRS